mgnify:CR=1 FL=1
MAHRKLCKRLLKFISDDHRKHDMVVSSDRNVLNKPLQECSKSGMARTGYSRSGKCENHDSDAGNHHVCMDINLSDSNSFCSLTGQSDWCRTKGACHDDERRMCDRDKWCVCQLAFSSVVDKIGCDNVDIDCSATSMRALVDYDRDEKHAEAAACIRAKCDK